MNGIVKKTEKNDASQPSQHNGNRRGHWQATPQQNAYLRILARAAGMQLDVSRLDRQDASRLINELKERRNGSSGKGTIDQRDRRIAFGMATKLVYMQWVETHHTPGKSEHFWKEVTEVFREYEKHQEAAMSGRPTAQEVAA